MLVLARKQGQEIIINDDLIVKVLSVDPYTGLVRLGFEAERDKYLVDRVELHLKKQKNDRR